MLASTGEYLSKRCIRSSIRDIRAVGKHWDVGSCVASLSRATTICAHADTMKLIVVGFLRTLAPNALAIGVGFIYNTKVRSMIETHVQFTVLQRKARKDDALFRPINHCNFTLSWGNAVAPRLLRFKLDDLSVQPTI